MTTEPREEPGTPLQQGFEFLKTRALAAHSAGDGFTVNHVCQLALHTLHYRVHAVPTGPIPGLDLADVRWVFFLWLHWLLDYDLRLGEGRRLWLVPLVNRLAGSPPGTYDCVLLSTLFATVEVPLRPAPTEPLLALPDDWLALRSHATEDVSALSLAVEFAWYSNPAGEAWRQLVARWQEKCPPSSRLAGTLQALGQRLETQATLGIGGQQGQLKVGATSTAEGEAASFELCWRAFLDCEWDLLDSLIKKLGVSTHVNTNEYFPLFSLIHFSRFFRESDPQFLSLSRRGYGVSRLPSQVFNDFRSHSFTSNSLKLYQQAHPEQGAYERWKCSVLAMLGQLSALRSWDLGRWYGAVSQQSDAHLEAARFGDPTHAMYGISSAVLALRSIEEGKDPRADVAIRLLDRLPPDSLTDLVRWLLARRPVEWWSAFRVLSDLSDAIPEPMLPEVARWSNDLSLSRKRLMGGSISYLDFWERILPFVPQAPQLIEVLRPAILKECTRPVSWNFSAGTLTHCLTTATMERAREIAGCLMGHQLVQNSPEEFDRWRILSNACANRKELLPLYREWLLGQPECTPVFMHLMQRLDEGTPPSQAKDDPGVRDWLRAQLLAFCEQSFRRGNEHRIIQPAFVPEDLTYVTWPSDEGQLIDNLIRLLEAPDVWYVNKVVPLGALAHLTGKLPDPSAKRICDFALRWIQTSLPGWAPPQSGPFSIGHFFGTDADTIWEAVLVLLDAVLRRFPVDSSDPIADWLIRQGLRQRQAFEDTLFLLLARLALTASGDHRGLVGLSEAVVQHADAANLPRCIHAFGSLLSPADGSPSLVLESSGNPACQLLLCLWTRRLRELAGHAGYQIRFAVAQVIRAWQKMGRKHPSLALPRPLEETAGILTRDSRARVRWALREEPGGPG